MVGALALVLALAQPCPDAAYAAAHRQFVLRLGCPAPVDGGRLYTAEGHRVVSERIAALEALAEGCDRDRARIIAERASLLEDARAVIDGLTSEVARLRVQLDTTTADLDTANREQSSGFSSHVAWAGTGVLVGVLATVAVVWATH